MAPSFLLAWAAVLCWASSASDPQACSAQECAAQVPPQSARAADEKRANDAQHRLSSFGVGLMQRNIVIETSNFDDNLPVDSLSEHWNLSLLSSGDDPPPDLPGSTDECEKWLSDNFAFEEPPKKEDRIIDVWPVGSGLTGVVGNSAEEYFENTKRFKDATKKFLKIGAAVAGPMAGIGLGLLSEYIGTDPNEARITELQEETTKLSKATECLTHEISEIKGRLTKVEEDFNKFKEEQGDTDAFQDALLAWLEKQKASEKKAGDVANQIVGMTSSLNVKSDWRCSERNPNLRVSDFKPRSGPCDPDISGQAQVGELGSLANRQFNDIKKETENFVDLLNDLVQEVGKFDRDFPDSDKVVEARRLTVSASFEIVVTEVQRSLLKWVETYAIWVGGNVRKCQFGEYGKQMILTGDKRWCKGLPGHGNTCATHPKPNDDAGDKRWREKFGEHLLNRLAPLKNIQNYADFKNAASTFWLHDQGRYAQTPDEAEQCLRSAVSGVYKERDDLPYKFIAFENADDAKEFDSDRQYTACEHLGERMMNLNNLLRELPDHMKGLWQALAKHPRILGLSNQEEMAQSEPLTSLNDVLCLASGSRFKNKNGDTEKCFPYLLFGCTRTKLSAWDHTAFKCPAGGGGIGKNGQYMSGGSMWQLSAEEYPPVPEYTVKPRAPSFFGGATHVLAESFMKDEMISGDENFWRNQCMTLGSGRCGGILFPPPPTFPLHRNEHIKRWFKSQPFHAIPADVWVGLRGRQKARDGYGFWYAKNIQFQWAKYHCAMYPGCLGLRCEPRRQNKNDILLSLGYFRDGELMAKCYAITHSPKTYTEDKVPSPKKAGFWKYI